MMTSGEEPHPRFFALSTTNRGLQEVSGCNHFTASVKTINQLLDFSRLETPSVDFLVVAALTFASHETPSPP
jgi:hypothetical protein